MKVVLKMTTDYNDWNNQFIKIKIPQAFSYNKLISFTLSI